MILTPSATELDALAKKTPLVWRPLAPGHSACAGCGVLLAARLVLEATGKNVIVVTATGCLEITTSRFPASAWEVPWIHSLFENAGAVAAGIESALRVLGKAEGVTVIAQAGDGGTADIGLQALSGLWERGHNVLSICYDNEAYMNTGVQRSSLTPLGARTTTSPPGSQSFGQGTAKKDIAAIAMAHGLPYVATATVGYPQDLMKKVKRAIAIEGPKYLHLLVPCPLGWVHDSSLTIRVAQLAVRTGLFPLYEWENGQITRVHRLHRRLPVEEYLKLQGRFSHLFHPENAAVVTRIQALADANAARFGFPPVTRGPQAEEAGEEP